MTVRVPLAVRLSTSRGDLHVTRQVRSLRFRTVVPGGFASCQIGLHRPLNIQPDEIDYYGKMYVYDARNGQTAWEGRVEDLGRGAGADGQVWDIAAVGPSAHAQDRTVPVVYVDSRMDSGTWVRGDMAAGLPKGDVTYADNGIGNSNPVIRLAWDSGQTIGSADRIVAQYMPISQTGQWIAALRGSHVEGATSAVLVVHAVGRVLPSWAGTILETDTWSTSAGTIAQRYGIDHSSKYQIMDIRIYQTSSSTSTAAYFSDLSNLVIIGSRLLRTGAEDLTTYPATYVVASDVVADLLGRVLSKYDGTNASITTTSTQIDQLAYPDGATPAKILDDLMAIEPDYYWQALETNANTGKWRFEWKAWPTSPRYEASIADGFDSPGSAVDLFNEAVVRYKSPNGLVKTVTRTSSVTALTNAGLTRTAYLDLGDEVGSLANAQRVGDQFLAQHFAPPNSGTLTVARPILDMTYGRYVMPWEIRPGELIRVRGVLPRVDALNATSRDGVTVFRLTAVEYDASSATARLELDSRPISVQSLVANRASTQRRR